MLLVAARLPGVEQPMNRPLRWIVGVSVLASAGCAGAVTEPPDDTPVPLPTLAIGPDTTLLVDEVLATAIVARDGNGAIIANPSLTWQSSSPAVASVDESGRV